MKKITLIPIILALSLVLIPLVSAHCPLCTAGAVAGVGAARYFGVDDSIVGLFLGALIISSALWFNKWLKKRVKRINFPGQEVLLIIITFLLFVIPFYSAGLITNFDMVKSMPEHHAMLGLGVYGIDKLFFGMIIGSLVIWGAFILSDYIKKKRGKVLWPFQGISFMAVALGILTLIFWLITK